jgi:parvulin-like peptidyl-prolyl isomerase
MKSALRFVLPVLAVAGVLAASGCGGNDDTPSNAAATVDGVAITKTDVSDLMARARRSYEAQKRSFPKAGTAEYQGLQSQAVAYLVQRLEFENEAKSRGISVTDAESDNGIKKLTDENFGGDKKALQKALKEQGVSDAQLRTDVRADVLAEELTASVSKSVSVSPTDITSYYTQNKSQYAVPETRDVRHILVKTKAKADDLAAQLENGADFAALAKQHSTDTGSKQNGGKLTISRGQTVAPFDRTAFALKKGDVSPPVKTEFGFHIIEALTDVKAAKTTPLTDVEESIRQQLLQTKKNEAMTKWVDDLKKDYEDKVSYAVGFNPPPATSTGATTEETE